MIKRFDIGPLRFTLSMNAIVKVVGVNSYVSTYDRASMGQRNKVTGKFKICDEESFHILMWDFDDVSLEEVKEALRVVQTRYCLSRIYILETKEKQSYCAYCFTILPWRRVIEILAQTNHLDIKYLKWCLFRGRLTLRVGPKMGRVSHCVYVLEGYQLPDATVEDMKSWVVYETLGGEEWLLKVMRRWQSSLTHLTCRLKLLLPMRSGKKL